MRDYLKRLKPTVFEDLSAMNALYRPGPMENIPYFIDCKHGRKKAKYEHPMLEPILDDTYGVFVYQEQVMAAANALAGFSMAQADELRRAMGKKIARRWRGSARSSSRAARRPRIPREGGRQDLHHDGEVRGLRLQQVAFAPPTRCSPTSARSSRRTIRPSSWRRRSPAKWATARAS